MTRSASYRRLLAASGTLACLLLPNANAHCQNNAANTAHEASIETLKDVYARAEHARNTGDMHSAKELYEQLLTLAQALDVPQRDTVQIGSRLASVYHTLGQYTNEQEVLGQLLSAELPDDQLLHIGMQQARLHFELDSPANALRVLDALDERVPQLQWRSDDRTLLYRVKERLNRHYEEITLTAERLFDAGLYAESAPLYEEAVVGGLEGLFADATRTPEGGVAVLPQIYYRLTQAYFMAGNYEKVVEILSQESPLPKARENSAALDKILRNQTYLLGLSLRQIGEYQDALRVFERYRALDEATVLEHLDNIQYEQGICHYKLDNFEKAQEHFSNLVAAGVKQGLRHRGQLYLARVNITLQNYAEAEKSLKGLAGAIPPDSDLQFERAFLLGEIYFELGKYQQAASQFETAIPSRNRDQADWIADALYHLGWSYLRMADDPVLGRSGQSRFFDSAEKAFKELIELKHHDIADSEKAHLALGQTYLRRGFRLNDDRAYQQAEALLAQEGLLSSLQAQAQALVLRAEATTSSEKRQELYTLLTDEKFQASPLWRQGWYLLGAAAFEEGQHLISQGKPTAAKEVFLRAIPALEKAFVMFKDSDHRRAGLALKYQAEAYSYFDDEGNMMQAFALYDSFIKHQRELLSSIPEPSEVYYRRGRVACRLADMTNDERFRRIAEQSMVHVISNYSDSRYTEESLNFLATLYFQRGDYLQAQHMFIKLASDHPRSKFAGNALFWAAECADWLKQSNEEIRALRKRVYEDHPDSDHSAEAYFTYYSYGDYLKGQQAAIDHLVAMKERFPSSPFLVNAYYLLGLEYKKERRSPEGTVLRAKDLSASIDAFEQAKRTMDYCFQQGMIPELKREYFVTVRYRALLEGALTNLQIAEDASGAKRQIYLEYAEAAFQRILNDLANPEHKQAQILQLTDTFNTINEEAHFGLAQVHVKTGHDGAAEKVLNEMLEDYTAAKITRGYLLSRVWSELGSISMRRGEHQLAIQFLEHAENAAKGRVLSAEQRLDLWIQQSVCHRAMNDLDEAMVILSKVINDDTISALRLKAMYLRAEIYEEQGRQELAIKQLEATSKKGGQWAQKAREKLVKDYGFR